MKVPVAAAKQAPAPGFGVLTLHAIKGRLQVLRPDGVVLDLEHTARRGVAGGYASLDASALVPFAQLGTGTATGSKFLRDDRTWQVPAGGGGGAPTDAQYLTLTTNATLTQERTISLTLPLSGSDGGAGAAYTFSLSGWSGTTDGRLLYRNGTALATATMTAPVVFSGGALSVSVFTGDSGSGGTTGLVPAPSAGDGMAGKYLAADGTWTQLPTGLAAFYLDSADSSDIATYKTALVSPATTAETTLTVGATGTGDNLLAAFATEPTVPGVTLLPHGVVSFHLHVATGAANQIGRVKVEIYTCNASGGSETLQASGYSDSFFDASQDINVDINIATGAAMATTDRLVFKVSAARVSGPATCNITVYFNGATRLAFAKTTIGALTPQIVGAQPWDADLTTFAALATDGVLIRSTTWQIATLTAPLTRTGATLSVAAATTSAAGVVELATNGEAIADRAVQGNDSRLGSAGAAAVGLVTWAGVGAGGTLTLDGTTTPTWGTWSTIGGVRTLTITAATSLEYNSVVWDFTTYPTLRIVTKGAKVAARTMTTVGTGTAYADWNGGDASGGTAGTGAAAVSAASPFGGGQSGAAGRATSGVGGTPGTYNQGVCLGGLGGAGGAAGATAGGAAGAFTRDFTPGSSTYGTIVDFMLRGGGMNWASGTSATNYQLSGAGGGAAGGNQVNGTSGGGGGGAGAQSWSIGSINMAANALYFRCLGGAGAAGVATSGGGTSGGGAGGGGGGLLLVIGSVTGTVYVQAHGGNGGNGTTTDADVAAGGAGGNGGLVACIYGAGTAPTGTATGGTGGTGSSGAAAANGSDGTVHIVSAVI